MAPNRRETDLEAALFALYKQWSQLPIPAGFSRAYYAERFRQMIVPGCKRYRGGIAAVKHVLTMHTTGFARLKPYPELTVESLIATGDWNDVLGDTLWQRIAINRLQGA